MTYDKPFMDYDDLLEHLRSRKIQIKNETFAKEALSNISYYTLINGYKTIFTTESNLDDFGGITFEELYTIHTIDTSLGSTLLKYILYIENSLKSKLSYIISKKYGVFTDYNDTLHIKKNDYLCRNYYTSRSRKRNDVLSLLREKTNPELKTYKSSSLLHYLNNHNHVPPWILATSLTFGNAILWFEILKGKDKTEVCNKFIKNEKLTTDERKEYIKKSFVLLKDFRNAIAHGNRAHAKFTNYQIPKKQLLILSFGLINEDEYYKSYSGKSGLHAVVSTIPSLLNDKYLITSYMIDLANIFKSYPDSKVLMQGRSMPELFLLPKDIIERIEKIIKKNR